MAGKFEVYKDKAGKYRFRLKAHNGQIVAVGEAYESRTAGRKACEGVMRAAGIPEHTARRALTASAGELDVATIEDV